MPRWLPRFSGLGDTLRSMQFNWQRALLKDSGSCFMWMLTAVLIMAIEAYRNGGADALDARGQPLLLAVFALVATLATLVLLRKRGVLKP